MTRYLSGADVLRENDVLVASYEHFNSCLHGLIK
jgi:hypothetical protein